VDRSFPGISKAGVKPSQGRLRAAVSCLDRLVAKPKLLRTRCSVEHLVSATEKGQRDGEAKRLGSLQVDDEFYRSDLLNRQIG
jgi:hypothetical protein